MRRGHGIAGAGIPATGRRGRFGGLLDEGRPAPHAEHGPSRRGAGAGSILESNSPAHPDNLGRLS